MRVWHDVGFVGTFLFVSVQTSPPFVLRSNVINASVTNCIALVMGLVRNRTRPTRLPARGLSGTTIALPVATCPLPRESSSPTRAVSSRVTLHRRARRQRHCDHHGRQRGMAGQRLRRAAIAQRQIRRGVSACLRQREKGSRFDRSLSRFYNGRRRPRAFTA